MGRIQSLLAEQIYQNIPCVNGILALAAGKDNIRTDVCRLGYQVKNVGKEFGFVHNCIIFAIINKNNDMFKRFRYRYYQLTLSTQPSYIAGFGGISFNFDVVIAIRGRISRDRILKHLSEVQDENTKKTLKEYPILIAWSEVDSF